MTSTRQASPGAGPMTVSEPLKVLDLFSGIGGFSLGLEHAGMETIAFCEYDEPCRKVLKKHWPDVPIHKDVRELDGKQYRGAVDVICGGYPCQPFSLAGKRRGADDDRHLWPEVNRLLCEIRPRWAIFENVFGHVSMGLDEVLSDLASAGYSTEQFIIPACAAGLWHRRDRVWIIANNQGVDVEKFKVVEKGQELGEPGGITIKTGIRALGRREDQPGMAGMAHGVPGWVDRLKQLGNAVVPQIPELIGRAIMAQAHKKAPV